MSQKLTVAGIGILLLVIVAGVTYDRGAGVVTVVLFGLIVGGAALAALDTNQKLRRQRRYLSRSQKAFEQRMTVVEEELLRRGAHIKAATQDDVVGTVKLMQEQYIGRLDRAQTDLEHAAAALRAAASTCGSE